jgi:hypothetical protein
MIDLDRGEKACPLDTEPDAVLQLIVGYRLVAVRQVHRDDRDEQHDHHWKRREVSHSDAPKKRVASRTPKAGYSQKIRGPLLMKGINA